MVVTNAKWWDGLPADVRTGLEQAMEQATTYANKMAAELNERDRKLIIADKKAKVQTRSEEHTSELQSLMRNSYAVFCLKKKKKKKKKTKTNRKNRTQTNKDAHH